MGTVASLKPGVSIDRANRALDRLTARLASEHRETNLGWGARVVSLDREVEGSFRPALFALLAASSLLLVIACINVANLMLARSTARGREVAIRGAIGASRQRIVALFLAESLILAAVGTMVGLAVGALSVKGLLACSICAYFSWRSRRRSSPQWRSDSGPRCTYPARSLVAPCATVRGVRNRKDERRAEYSSSRRSRWQSCCFRAQGCS
jgi:hypothetical protein